MKSVFLIIVLAVVTGCASKKNPSSNSEKTTQVNSMNDTTSISKNEILPLIVQFYSIGTGVKAETITMLDTYTADFEKASGKKVIYQKVPWGREGEVDACFRLSGLNDEQRQTFISGLKRLYTDEHHVHILENQACHYIR